MKLLVQDVPDGGEAVASLDDSHSPRTRDALRHMYTSGLPPHRNT